MLCPKNHADGSCTCHLSEHVRQTLPKRYRHYKGGVYTKLLEAQHEETGVTMVIYQGEDGRPWVRPYDLFHGKVVDDKRNLVDRYSLVEDESSPVVSAKPTLRDAAYQAMTPADQWAYDKAAGRLDDE